MKRIAKVLALSFLVVGFAFSSAQALIYTSSTDFINAFTPLPGITVENFEDPVLEPGLSIDSDWGGYTTNGQYFDRIGGTSDWQTDFTHSGGFYGFGGFWDLYNPGGPGTSIDVYADGNYVGNIASSYAGQFWGFDLGGTKFNTVTFAEGPNSANYETYVSVDIMYAVPEPGTMLLLGVGLIGFAAVGRKKFFNKAA